MYLDVYILSDCGIQCGVNKLANTIQSARLMHHLSYIWSVLTLKCKEYIHIYNQKNDLCMSTYYRLVNFASLFTRESDNFQLG